MPIETQRLLRTIYEKVAVDSPTYGESAKAEESAEQSGAASGVFWVIGAVIVIAVVAVAVNKKKKK